MMCDQPVRQHVLALLFVFTVKNVNIRMFLQLYFVEGNEKVAD